MLDESRTYESRELVAKMQASQYFDVVGSVGSFGELQRAELTAPKRMAQTIMRRLRSRLTRLIEEGKAAGALSPTLDADAAVTCLIGMVQGLVMQSLLANDVGRIRREAPRVFAIYLHGIGSHP